VVLPFTLNAEKTDSAAESYEYTVSEIDNLLTESDVMAPNDRHDRKACNIVVIEDDPNLRSYLDNGSRNTTTYTPRQTAAKASPKRRESAPRSSSPT